MQGSNVAHSSVHSCLPVHGCSWYMSAHLACIVFVDPRVFEQQLHLCVQEPIPLRPPNTSCRSPGNVVNLLTANNGLLPVTLAITPRDTEDGMTYVVEVSSDFDLMNIRSNKVQSHTETTSAACAQAKYTKLTLYFVIQCRIRLWQYNLHLMLAMLCMPDSHMCRHALPSGLLQASLGIRP